MKIPNCIACIYLWTATFSVLRFKLSSQCILEKIKNSRRHMSWKIRIWCFSISVPLPRKRIRFLRKIETEYVIKQLIYLLGWMKSSFVPTTTRKFVKILRFWTLKSLMKTFLCSPYSCPVKYHKLFEFNSVYDGEISRGNKTETNAYFRGTFFYLLGQIGRK